MCDNSGAQLAQAARLGPDASKLTLCHQTIYVADGGDGDDDGNGDHVGGDHLSIYNHHHGLIW